MCPNKGQRDTPENTAIIRAEGVGIAQVLEHLTEKPSTVLTWVRVPGAARDCPPSQLPGQTLLRCLHSPRIQSHASTSVCTLKSQTLAAILLTWRTIPCCTRDLNPCQYCAGLFSQTLYQLSYSHPFCPHDSLCFQESCPTQCWRSWVIASDWHCLHGFDVSFVNLSASVLQSAVSPLESRE